MSTLVRTVANRWPVAAAVAVAAGTLVGLERGVEVAPIVTASAFCYLGAAALRLPWAAWPMFFVSGVFVTIGKLFPDVNVSWMMIGLIAAITAFGLLRGAARPSWGVPLQTLAMAGFVAAALTAIVIDPTAGAVLVATALLGHTAWDIYHHRTNRVVIRSLSEFCAVLDTLLALGLLTLTFA